MKKGKAKPRKLDLGNGYELVLRGNAKMITPESLDLDEEIVAGVYSERGSAEIIIRKRRSDR